MKVGILSLAVALAVLSVAGAGVAADPARALDLITPGRVQAAKDFQVPTPDNGRLRLVDLKGKVVLVNFWATWCPPCREELPGMERLYQRYKGKGLVVVAISLDMGGTDVVSRFLRAHKLTFPVGLDPTMTVANLYGVRALPASFIIDRTGTLSFLALGPREWDGEDSQALFDSLLRFHAELTKRAAP